MTEKPKKERRHKVGAEVKIDGKRLQFQFDELTVAFIPSSSGVRPFAMECLEKFWKELHPNESVPDHGAIIATLAEEYKSSRAHVVKAAIIRHGSPNSNASEKGGAD